MPIVGNFTRTQVYGEPSKLYLTDTTTGSDVTVTKRRVTITDKDNKTYVEDGTTTSYEEWNDFPATTTITLDLFKNDGGYNIKVEWLTSTNSVVDSKTILTNISMYGDTMFINLVKSQSGNDKLKDKNGFYENMLRLSGSLEQAETAIEILQDISSCQAAHNRAKPLINNPSYYF